MVTRGVPHTIPLPAIIIRILDCQLHSLNVLNKIEWNKLTKVKTLVNVAFHILILQLQNTNLKKISILPFWVVFTIGIKPELQKSCIFVGDKDLCSKKLIFIPGQCHFKTTIIIQVLNNIDIIVKPYSAILHQYLNSFDVRSMRKAPPYEIACAL